MAEAAAKAHRLYIDGKWVAEGDPRGHRTNTPGNLSGPCRASREMVSQAIRRGPHGVSGVLPAPCAQAFRILEKAPNLPGPGTRRRSRRPSAARPGRRGNIPWARCSGRWRRSSSPPRRPRDPRGDGPDGRQHRRGGTDGFWLRCPIGVSAAISPFNFPPEPRGTQSWAGAAVETRCPEARNPPPR